MWANTSDIGTASDIGIAQADRTHIFVMFTIMLVVKRKTSLR